MVIVCASCQSDKIENEQIEKCPAVVQLKVTGQEQANIATRSINEDVIHDLHILIYDSKGELIGQQYAISNTVTVNTHNATNCTIYAIANTGKPDLFNSYDIHSETVPKELVYSISTWNELTNNTYLPMTGSMNNVNIVAGAQSLSGMVVNRMAAKITLDIKAKNNSGIIITDYTIHNIPLKSNYIGKPLSTEDKKDDTNTIAGADAVNALVPADWADSEKVTVNAASTTHTFYMFENRRGVVPSIKEQQDKVLSNAPVRATYVDINGRTGSVTANWKVFLGGNAINNFNIKRNCTYKYNITLNDIITADTRVNIDFTNVIDLSASSTSNCYLAPNTCTWYKIRADIRGNGAATSAEISPTGSALPAKALISPVSAELVWETGEAKGIIQSLSLITEDGGKKYIRFKTGHLEEGNAVIAAKDIAGNIIWSWHIWKTHFGLEKMPTQNYRTNPRTMNPSLYKNGLSPRLLTMMDRNLGAADNTPSNTEAVAKTFGLFYQFGRKDPFPSAKDKQGNVCVYDKLGTELDGIIKLRNANYQIKNIDIPNKEVVAQSINYAICHPLTFILCGTPDGTSSNWIYGADIAGTTAWNASYKLWGGDLNNGASSLMLDTKFTGKTIYDPCPAGWCMPPQDTWTNFTTTNTGEVSPILDYNTKNESYYNTEAEDRKNWGVDVGGFNSAPVFGRRFYIDGTSGETAFYPATGYRYGGSGASFDGLLLNFGYYCCLWSSSPANGNLPYAHYLYAYNEAVDPVASVMRAYAFPVRCVKESSF